MLLLLAGTGEAREIARGIADLKIPAIASIAGATRDPAKIAIPHRAGGFGGAAGFEEFLDHNGIRAIIDATHPFASRITQRSAAIAQRRGLPYLLLLRPKWESEAGDNWVELADEEQAAAHIPVGAKVFLATGRQTLPKFANLVGRRLICRQIDPPDGPFPFENGEYLVGRPPFSLDEEINLFKERNIDWLVVKNAGGSASRTKLTAARHLGIPVAVIERPPAPDAMTVETVAEVLDWARGLEWG